MVNPDPVSVATGTVDDAFGKWTHFHCRPAHLAGLVEHVWLFDGSMTCLRERTFPNGLLEIIVHLGERYRVVESGASWVCPATCVTGLQLGPLVVEAPAQRTKVLGVRLTPAGAYAVFARPMHELSGLTVDLEDLAGAAANQLAAACQQASAGADCVRAAIGWIDARLAHRTSLDPAVGWMLGQIRQREGAVSIGQLRDRTGWSKTRLASTFQEQVGVSPKQYARVMRFSRVLKSIHGQIASFADAASEAGYVRSAAHERRVQGAERPYPEPVPASPPLPEQRERGRDGLNFFPRRRPSACSIIRVQQRSASMVKEYRRPGYRSVTPGLSVDGSAAFVDFLTRAFGAREGDITRNKDGSIGHGEIWIGDSLIEISEARPQWPARPCSLHFYVTDTDATYATAVAAGAAPVSAPADAPYGDRTATVRDAAGNLWFIATRLSGPPIPEGLRAITPYVITAEADAVMAFTQAAFGATQRVRVPADDGRVMHAEMQVDDSVVEFSDGSKEWPPTKCQLHVYVPDADAAYRRALDAGATSVYEPMDQPYGDRECGVLDAGGNHWFIATHQGS